MNSMFFQGWRKYAHLFSQFASGPSVELPYLHNQLVLKLVLLAVRQHFFFVSELLDLLLTGEDK